MSSRIKKILSGDSGYIPEFANTSVVNLGTEKKELAAIPTIDTIERAFNMFDFGDTKNRYTWYAKMFTNDATTYRAITIMGKIVRSCYLGVTVHSGETMEGNEEKLLKECTKIAKKFKYKDMFEQIAIHLLRDGDDIYYLETKDGKDRLRSMPIRAMTILNNTNQLGKPDEQVTEKNVYVYNEEQFGAGEDASKLIIRDNDDSVLHFSLGGDYEVQDVMGRITYGIWSIPPMEPLRTEEMWKAVAVLNDIQWRLRNVPREHHKLDLSAYDPNRYPGTAAEKINAAKTAAEALLSGYSSNIKAKRVDQGYISGNEVTIEPIEFKTSGFRDPNELLDQIDGHIVRTIGAPESAAPIKRGNPYASELISASWTSLDAVSIAEKIRDKMLEFLKSQLEGNYNEEELDKIDLKLQLVLDVTLNEVARRIAVLASTESFTPDEIRAMIGYDQLTEDQKTEIKEINKQGRTNDHSRTMADTASHEITSGHDKDVKQPDTAQSKSDRQET